MQQSLKIALPRELVATDLTTSVNAVRRYAELTTDFNPIHLDPEFAANTVFGAPIIHGTLALNLIVQTIDKTFGRVPAELEINVRFVRPVPVGTTIRGGGRLLDPATGTYEIFVDTQAGERAIEGTCVLGARG